MRVKSYAVGEEIGLRSQTVLYRSTIIVVIASVDVRRLLMPAEMMILMAVDWGIDAMSAVMCSSRGPGRMFKCQFSGIWCSLIERSKESDSIAVSIPVTSGRVLLFFGFV